MNIYDEILLKYPANSDKWWSSNPDFLHDFTRKEVDALKLIKALMQPNVNFSEIKIKPYTEDEFYTNPVSIYKILKQIEFDSYKVVALDVFQQTRVYDAYYEVANKLYNADRKFLLAIMNIIGRSNDDEEFFEEIKRNFRTNPENFELAQKMRILNKVKFLKKQKIKSLILEMKNEFSKNTFDDFCITIVKFDNSVIDVLEDLVNEHNICVNLQDLQNLIHIQKTLRKNELEMKLREYFVGGSLNYEK